ncbi:MAG: GerMN domain-containing protein [Lachnospiraceae bacterium]
MKAKRVWILLLLVMCLTAGCGEKKQIENKKETPVYYVNNEESKLVPVNYELKEKTPQKQIAELMYQLTKTKNGTDYKAAIPPKIKIESYKLENRQLYVYFNEGYSELGPVQEVLLRAALVRTMIQVKGVDCVSFYIADAPLLDAKDKLVGVMTADTFVENLGRQINSIETKEITLYFANKEGTKLVAEKQNVYGSTNSSMEKLVMQHLMKGPKKEGLRATVPAGTKLISVSTLDGVCFVNLDSGYMKQNYELSEAVVIYSIVNSLSELSAVNKVQISVNGDTNMTYRTDFKFDVIYERNLDIVVKKKEKEEKAGD